MAAGRFRRIPDWQADLERLEQRSDDLKRASGALREKSKYLLEPRSYLKQKLRELQLRQGQLFNQMSNQAVSVELREAARSIFAEGEQEITGLLVLLQKEEDEENRDQVPETAKRRSSGW